MSFDPSYSQDLRQKVPASRSECLHPPKPSSLVYLDWTHIQVTPACSTFHEVLFNSKLRFWCWDGKKLKLNKQHLLVSWSFGVLFQVKMLPPVLSYDTRNVHLISVSLGISQNLFNRSVYHPDGTGSFVPSAIGDKCLVWNTCSNKSVACIMTERNAYITISYRVKVKSWWFGNSPNY